MVQVAWAQLVGAGQTGAGFGRTVPLWFWGLSPACETLIKTVADRHDTIRVFDTEKIGATAGRRYTAEPFSLDGITQLDKEHCVVVATFQDQQMRVEALEVLRKLGFQRCYDTDSFLTAYALYKIYDDCRTYQEANRDSDFMFDQRHTLIIIDEWFQDAGVQLNDSYVVQDLWGARKVFEARPERHYDIGSSVQGFIMHLLAFNMPTTLIDVRPLQTYGTENLDFIQADATTLSGLDDESVESLSALCSFEHFGLGRYGDPVNPAAHLMAFESARRVLKKGGNLYISLPVGNKNLLAFNAHRIYAPRYVREQFGDLDMVEFSLCTGGGLVKDVPLDANLNTSGFTGLFHFKKP